ncbi:MAG TPA: cytochrome P450 [Myxococcota bacterium]|nr:cytochrome P450 [Myxococcota bacterium]
MTVIERLDDALFAVDMLLRAAREGLETGVVFNPKRKDLRIDPYPFYAELRERDPIHRSYAAGGWVLSRYDDILGVLADRRYSSDERNWSRRARLRARGRRAGLPDMYDDGLASMLRIDPPDHTRLRGLVSKAFTPRAVERMRPRIEAVVDELLGGLEGRSEIELVREFGAPLPVAIIAEMLGIPSADRARFRHGSDEAVRLLGDGTKEDRRRGGKGFRELMRYLEGEVATRRREPRDDLLSAMVAAEEAGDRLSTQELFSTCVLLLVAGNETTTNLIGNGMIALLRHPEQLERLRREPKRIPGAVEELLRYDSPVQLTSRIVLEEGELRGRKIRRGEQLVLLLGAGNRDPARFADPERLDIAREDVHPLSFGHGIHYCLGAQLARLEAQIAFEGLIERFPDLRFGAGSIAWGDNTILRGPTSLPLAVR